MPLFLSTVTMKVDRKGRVSVPANFRAAVGNDTFNGIILYPSFRRPCLDGADMGFMERLSESIHGDFGLYSDSHEALATATLASAQQLTFDSDGRVGLPKDLAAHAGITDQATFVGLGRTFQIWEPDAYQAHRSAQQAAAEKAAKDLSPIAPRNNGGEG